MASLDIAKLRADFEGPRELVRTSDGKVLFVRRWNARGESPVSILIFHGMTGYSGPYGGTIGEIGPQLSAAGFNVFGMDLRGHGLSDGRRGDYPSEERFVKDLAETLQIVRTKSRKVVVLGHSLGASCATVVVNNRPEDVDGLILLSIAKKIRRGVYPRPKASTVLKTLLAVSIFRRTPLIEYRREGMTGLDDPLMNFKYSARFYSVVYGVGALRLLGMFRSGLIESPNLEFRKKLAVPLIVGVGEHDELFAIESAKEFCDGIDCDDKGFFVVPGARHASFPSEGWGPILTWLGKF
jgi:acylglycerol lipase